LTAATAAEEPFHQSDPHPRIFRHADLLFLAEYPGEYLGIPVFGQILEVKSPAGEDAFRQYALTILGQFRQFNKMDFGQGEGHRGQAGRLVHAVSGVKGG